MARLLATSAVVSPARERAAALPRFSSRSAVSRLLVQWHLLSLDAPTVATLWTVAAAHSRGVALPPTLAPAAFLAVWLLYAVDRLLDARRGGPELETRHHFHQRHRRSYIAGMALATAALIPLLLALPWAVNRPELVLGALLAGWFLLIHVRSHGSQASPRRLPKECVVGLFFAAATFLPAAVFGASTEKLMPPALLFAALCSLNCLFIYKWEHAGQPAPASLAHASTRAALQHLPALTWMLILLACAVASLGRDPLAMACAVSAAGLLYLDRTPHRSSLLQRAAADFVLLTPALLWLAR